MSAKRSYSSPLREEAAARTRALILEAATLLFAERGYGRVTVADIAATAGVSSKTVFASAGSKADILNTIVERGVGSSGAEAVMHEIADLSSPSAVLKALARGTRLGNERQFPVVEAIRLALPVHEDASALWQRATGHYQEILRQVGRHLASLRATSAFSVEDTAALLWMWFSPSGWRALVVEQGFNWDSAESLLYRTAVATLYPDCPET